MSGRAALFHGAGRAFEMVRYEIPSPRGAEVRVRVLCCTLCRSDLHTHAGRRTEPTPLVVGHEIVGRVEEFGPDAVRGDVALGDRVTWAMAVGCGACYLCGDGLPQKCERLFKYGHTRGLMAGGLADYVLLTPGTPLFRVPDAVSDRVAALANCATATAAAVLRTAGPLEGRTVLVLGAGVLGATACAMAKAAGAAVRVSDPQPAMAQRALEFGATADPLPERGADVVLELAGAAESVREGLRLVRVGGTLVLAGTVAPVAPVELDPERVVRRMLTIRGVHNYHPDDLLTALNFLVGPGRAYPFESLVGDAFALDEIEQAFVRAHAAPGTRIAVVP